ncbi:MBL fold metallo-hydrolase [Sphingobium yanoikuyae]|uniref:MBL fold metallo-hydrolase n=1 Tax=Sphingobium yanoikuyae TaxID=13690 RepID=A0A9X7YDV5_SPHYA|nr:MBL fold metallo-hydrolase [Sphingobium yanoikuyae]QNG46945.1 MBL fold metallo-hydrolase [Sphingobium yanoikuyae]
MSELKALAVHGDAFLYRSSNGTVLVDGGGSSRILGKVLAKELPEVSHLDVVVCTHADSDHAKGLRSILTEWRSAGQSGATIGEFWLPGRWMDIARRGLTDPKDLMSKLIEELDAGKLDDGRALIWTESDDDAGGSFEDEGGNDVRDCQDFRVRPGG